MKARLMTYDLRLTMMLSVLSFILSGCVVRTYPLERERVDQDLSVGNRGYLQGQPPSEEVAERQTTRTTRVVEIELHPPIKFEGARGTASGKKDEVKAEEMTSEGNRGYITRSVTPEVAEPSAESTEKYIVKKGETLQKISLKYYGTTKKWNKIFEANKDKLKAPNKIYPGQVIDIPVEQLKEPKENLK